MTSQKRKHRHKTDENPRLIQKPPMSAPGALSAVEISRQRVQRERAVRQSIRLWTDGVW